MIEDLLGRAYSEIGRRAARGERDALLRQDPGRVDREEEAWDTVEQWFAPGGRHGTLIDAITAPKKKQRRRSAGTSVQSVKTRGKGAP